jgi:hypothetical protein
VIGGAELGVETAWLDLEAELLVLRLGGVDAIDHHHDMIQPPHRALMPASGAPC